MVYSPEELEKYYRLRAQRAKEAKVEGKPKAAAEGAEEKRKAKAEAEAKPRERKPHPFNEMLGKKVRFVLLDGEEFEAKLSGVTRYELVLENGRSRILLFKHAIKAIYY